MRFRRNRRSKRLPRHCRYAYASPRAHGTREPTCLVHLERKRYSVPASFAK